MGFFIRVILQLDYWCCLFENLTASIVNEVIVRRDKRISDT